MIRAKPLFGWGYGDYSLYAGQFQRRVQNYVASEAHASHNAFLTVGAELGLPALFAFLFSLFWWLWLSFKVRPRMPKEGFWSRSLLVIFWLALIGHVTVTIFTAIRHSTYAQGLWWIPLGLIGNMVNCYLAANSPKPSRGRHVNCPGRLCGSRYGGSGCKR